MASISSTTHYPRITAFDGQVFLCDPVPSSRKGRCVVCHTPQGRWVFTEGQVLREYLGNTVFRCMGIRVPEFKMGIVEESALAEKKMVFMQWLPAGVQPVGVDLWSSLQTAEKVRLFCAGQLVGDADFLGSTIDSILYVPTVEGKVEAPIKIHCEQAFSQLAGGHFFITQRMIGLMDELKQNESPECGQAVDAFIGALDPDRVADALSTAYQQLKEATADLPPSVTRVLDLDQLSLGSVRTIDELRRALSLEWYAVKSAYMHQWGLRHTHPRG
jgi:hypothetical protein